MLTIVEQKVQKNNLAFLKVALKDIRTTGSVTSSSKYLIKKMVEPIDFKIANTIVEFGAGEGCITREILKKTKASSKILSFELNETLFEHLQIIKDRRLSFINDNVTELGNYVADNSVDAIISGLPLTNIPKAVKQKILAAALISLKPNGLFIQYQYSLLDYKFLKKYFKEVKLDFALLNFPPAFVYICKK